MVGFTKTAGNPLHLLTRHTERGITLLTQLAYGDVAVVRNALIEHGEGKDIKKLIEFVVKNRDPSRRPAESSEPADRP